MNSKKIISMALSVALATTAFSSCGTGSAPAEQAEVKEVEIIAPAEVSTWVSLTVAEGKRLIAKGIMQSPEVAKAMENAAVLIARGSTNQYVLEEFMGQRIEDGSFMTGRITPKGKAQPKVNDSKKEYLYKAGKLSEVESFEEALQSLPKGSVVFKGGNIMNHNQNKAAVLIGHPTGGSIGAIDKVLSDDIKLIVPIGLEKNSSVDMDFMAVNFAEKQDKAPAIHILNGAIFTEIEAIKCVADVEVYQYASGGVNGAEGAVSLLIRGDAKQVAIATEFIDSVYGEPALFSEAE